MGRLGADMVRLRMGGKGISHDGTLFSLRSVRSKLILASSLIPPRLSSSTASQSPGPVSSIFVTFLLLSKPSATSIFCQDNGNSLLTDVPPTSSLFPLSVTFLHRNQDDISRTKFFLVTLDLKLFSALALPSG